jgi:hypothetical protein
MSIVTQQPSPAKKSLFLESFVLQNGFGNIHNPCAAAKPVLLHSHDL